MNNKNETTAPGQQYDARATTHEWMKTNRPGWGCSRNDHCGMCEAFTAALQRAHDAGAAGVETIGWMYATAEERLNTARAEITRLSGEVAALKAALNRDKTGLAQGLVDVTTRAKGGEWISEGRGSYEWDDEKYREETGRLVDDVIRIARTALEASSTLVHAALATTPVPPGAPRVEMTVAERVEAIHGGIYGGNTDPHRCMCAEQEKGRYAGTPHVHYDEPPYSCARCKCDAYVPAAPPGAPADDDRVPVTTTEVVCRYCDAPVGELCKGEHGEVAYRPHRARLLLARATSEERTKARDAAPPTSGAGEPQPINQGDPNADDRMRPLPRANPPGEGRATESGERLREGPVPDIVKALSVWLSMIKPQK